MKTEEKSNEITAIPERPELLDVKGMILTIGAMGYQKKTTAKIDEKQSDYVISLKVNHSSLYDDVKDFVEHRGDHTSCKDYKIKKWECDIEKEHRRSKTRQ